MESWVGIIIFLIIIFIFIGIFVYLWYSTASTTAWLVVAGLFFFIIVIMLLVWAFYPSTPAVVAPPPVMAPPPPMVVESPPPEPQQVLMSYPEYPPPVNITINGMSFPMTEEVEEYIPPSVINTPPPVVKAPVKVVSTPRVMSTPISRVGRPVTAQRQVTRGPSINAPVKQAVVGGVPSSVQETRYPAGNGTFDAYPYTEQRVERSPPRVINAYDADLGRQVQGVYRPPPRVVNRTVDPYEREVVVSYT